MKLYTDFNDYLEIADAIKNGAIALFPTETVYGLGCKLDVIPYKKLYQIKKRPAELLIPVMVANTKQLLTVADVSDQQLALIKALSPGPITFIVKKSANFPADINAGSDTVAVRIPDLPPLLDIIELVGPMLVTSGNIHAKAPVNPKDVAFSIFEQLDVIVHTKVPSSNCSSTIYDMDNHKILREGTITLKTIEDKLAQIKRR